MKAYKLEILVIDHEQHGPEEIKLCIENEKYMSPSVMNIEEVDIGEWSDNHPLNKHSTAENEYRRLFNVKMDKSIPCESEGCTLLAEYFNPMGNKLCSDCIQSAVETAECSWDECEPIK